MIEEIIQYKPENRPPPATGTVWMGAKICIVSESMLMLLSKLLIERSELGKNLSIFGVLTEEKLLHSIKLQ